MKPSEYYHKAHDLWIDYLTRHPEDNELLTRTFAKYVDKEEIKVNYPKGIYEAVQKAVEELEDKG